MKSLPAILQKKIDQRKANNAYRILPSETLGVDFSSNDYLGFSRSKFLQRSANQYLSETSKNGATGSRLLSGNNSLNQLVEKHIASFHWQESALIYNSGYSANIGFFSCVPQRGDVVFYDELIHASIRDGMQMGLAKNLNFKHNNFSDLAAKIHRWKSKHQGTIYVVTESVFSMDGDSPDLVELARYCQNNDLYLIVDEAHAIGVFGTKGEGLVNMLKIQDLVFAQIVTYGKGLGCHGAAILGSEALKSYLINFSRSFIYTTALPPHALTTILGGYNLLVSEIETQKKLRDNIAFFNSKIIELKLENYFINSQSAIHCCIVSGIENVKKSALLLQNKGYDIKPILSPTVEIGKERLRFCLHSFNSFHEIESALKLVSELVIS